MNNPPSRSNLDDSLLMFSKKVVNKQIDAAAPHNKIPMFEIIPTPIGYPQVWARSRITRLSLMLWILEKYKIARYKIEEGNIEL